MRLQEVVREALTVIQPAAELKKLRISTDISEAIPPFFADARRVRQVMINLLNNDESNLPLTVERSHCAFYEEDVWFSAAFQIPATASIPSFCRLCSSAFVRKADRTGHPPRPRHRPDHRQGNHGTPWWLGEGAQRRGGPGSNVQRPVTNR